MKEIIIGGTTYFCQIKNGNLYYDKQRRIKVGTHMFLKSQYESYLEQLQYYKNKKYSR